MLVQSGHHEAARQLFTKSAAIVQARQPHALAVLLAAASAHQNATYRAETSCDRETASLACALVIHQRRIRDFTRGLEDMRAMGFDDEDGAASAALMRCDFDVRRAVETHLAASRT